MDDRSWSQEQVAVALALAGVALMLAFALGVEVGSAAVYRAFAEEGLNCAEQDGLVWS